MARQKKKKLLMLFLEKAARWMNNSNHQGKVVKTRVHSYCSVVF